MQLLSLACRLHLQQLSEKGEEKCQIKGFQRTNLIALVANTTSSNKLQYDPTERLKVRDINLYLAHLEFALKLVQFSLHLFRFSKSCYSTESKFFDKNKLFTRPYKQYKLVAFRAAAET